MKINTEALLEHFEWEMKCTSDITEKREEFNRIKEALYVLIGYNSIDYDEWVHLIARIKAMYLEHKGEA